MVEELEALIRRGQIEEVERRLQALHLSKVPRSDAHKIANIARRVNRPRIAVRLLNPIVRPEGKLQAPATAIEKIEYADALRRLGAVHEAWEIYHEVDVKEYPQALIGQVFCLFNQWKYQESLPLLRQYISFDHLAPYARVVGQVNLAAALVYEEQIEEASLLLEELREITQKSDFKLLYGNALELTSQLLILQMNWAGALECLEKSAEVLKTAGSRANIFGQKWSAIAESLQRGRVSENLKNVLFKAQTESQWETVRDCELYIARIENNVSLFEKIYFGTPFLSYRKRICQWAGEKFKPSEAYLWTLDPKPKSILDIKDAHISGPWANQSLSMGHAVHRFLILLTQDFYRPLPVLSAFAALFPDEYMNTLTSPNRVHQIVLRTRAWFSENHFPLEIEEIQGSYRLLLPPTEVGIQIPRRPLPLDSQELQWRKIEAQVHMKTFSIHDICRILDCSETSAHRLLRWALAQQKIHKSGRSSRTSYQRRTSTAA